MTVGIAFYDGGTGNISELLEYCEIVSEIFRENSECIEMVIGHRDELK